MSKKISNLSDGGKLSAGDLLALVRDGLTYKAIPRTMATQDHDNVNIIGGSGDFNNLKINNKDVSDYETLIWQGV